jgi:vitamin B12 transporter
MSSPASPIRVFIPIVSSVLLALSLAGPAAAQAPVAGVVTDELGGAVAGAVITVRTTGGAAVATTTTGADGGFSIAPIAPGRYEVEAAMALFDRARELIDIPQNGEAPAVRLVMAVAGLVESMVVTGRRTETRLAETPQKIELIDRRDIERSVAADITDVLKKNSGVEVVQYSGVLSGIGIRGFRPETSGLNKRSLLLVDGRPSGVTNLSTLMLDNVERIEVLKGPASAIYGASAMGGVVNVITRRSRGPVTAGGRVAVGRYNTSDLAGHAGGSLGARADFDVAGTAFNQRDDFRMGNGMVRPATSYRTYDGSARAGIDLAGAWRLDGSVGVYRGRDINTPGDVFAGLTSQGRKNLERAAGDLRISGPVAGHLLSGTFYTADEQNHTFNVTTTNPLDLPYLPYLTFENELGWSGAQLRDAWSWSSSSSLLIGLDVERATSESWSYARTGDPLAPFSANSRKNTVGVYAEHTVRLFDARTVVSAGGRVDRIAVETVATPYKTNFTPSTTTFAVFNPSVGVKQQIVEGVRLHATAGRAFVPADAGALTGYTTNIVGGRIQINQGNPDLRPERSVSGDVGIELLAASSLVDVTYFRTSVKDRVVSNVLLSNPPPPDPIVLTAANSLGARISGLDVDIAHRLNPAVSVFANATHYFARREQLPTTGERNILNVATDTVRAGVDLDVSPVSARLAARYVHGRQDQDFNLAGSPVVDYPDFVVADLSAMYRVHPYHAVLLSVNNLFDRYYYEKKGYPLQGLGVTVKYQLGR